MDICIQPHKGAIERGGGGTYKTRQSPKSDEQEYYKNLKSESKTHAGWCK